MPTYGSIGNTNTFTAGVDEEIALPGVELGGCDHLSAQYFGNLTQAKYLRKNVEMFLKVFFN